MLIIQGRVIEPLRDFHKDEVRRLGKDLGLPDHFVQRHPFPGKVDTVMIKRTPLCAALADLYSVFIEVKRRPFG